MRLNTLHLTNFRQHAETRIEFDLGITGVIGPNGAGKSTILEAIAWALYGQTAARGTRDSIRFLRAGARAPVRVELDFELAGHRYRVVRGLTSAEVYLDGGAEPVASSVSGVTDLLQRRLGMTRAEFFNTYFTGQKELNVMAALAPTERAQFLSRVLGYDKLRTAQALVRERRKLIVAEIAGVRSAMPDPAVVARTLEESRARLAVAAQHRAAAEAGYAAAESAYQAVVPRWEEAQRMRDATQQLLSDLRVAASDEAARARDLERMDRELAEVAGASAELTVLAAQIGPLSEVLGEFRHLEELAREEGRRQTLVEQERALGEELARFRARQATIARAPQLDADVTEKVERKRRALEETTAALEARRTDWVRDRQEAETKRDALRVQWTELKKQLEHLRLLGPEGNCPTCTRKLGENFAGVVDQLQAQFETIVVDGKYFNTRVEQLAETPADIRALESERRALTQEVATLERQHARVQAAVQELAQLEQEIALKAQHHDEVRRDLAAIPLGYDAARHAELGAQMARLAPLNERAARLSAHIDREPALRAERDRLAAEREAAAARVATLRREVDASRFSEEEFTRIRQEHDRMAAAARGAEVALLSARSDEGAASTAVAHAEGARVELERARERHQALEREKRLHDELDRAYSDLRTDLNFQLRPELAEVASGFLSDITDTRYAELELDDQYNVVVMEDGVPKPVISGGEEDLSNLVLRLAISQMIAERAGQSFSLLVLDEIFGSLDEIRRQNVVELLRHLQDRFEQVVLITHIESVREQLDRVILVEYDEHTGASRVRQVEPSIPSFPESLAEAASEPIGGGAER